MLTTVFRLLGRLRHARAFHPRGVLFTGELTAEADNSLPLPASAPVVVRLSKGAGTPGGLPDVLGLAVRIPLSTGDWDLLLSSSGTGRVSRMLPTPARSWRTARFGTIVPYRCGHRLFWLLAVPENVEPPARFKLRMSCPDGSWQTVAHLRLDTTEPTVEEPSFDPMLNRPPGLEMAPAWLARWREEAYVGSRSGRVSS